MPGTKESVNAFGETFADLIVTSLGIVAALSWNEYIKSLFAEGGVFHRLAGTRSLLIVAVTMTVLAFIATYIVSNLFPGCIDTGDTKFKKKIRDLKEKDLGQIDFYKPN